MSFNTIKVNNTQIVGVDEEPTAGSNNLVNSGGIDERISLGNNFVKTRYLPISVENVVTEFGSINMQTGEDIASTNIKRTDYIELYDQGPANFINRETLADYGQNVVYYDQNKNFVSSQYNTGSLTIPATAKYIRFTLIAAYESDFRKYVIVDRAGYNKIIENGSFYIEANTATRIDSNTVYNGKEKLSLIDFITLKRVGILQYKTANICDPALCDDMHTLNAYGVIRPVVNPIANCLMTVPVEGGKQYRIITGWNRQVQYFDENDVWISAETGNDDYVFTAPANAFLMRFTHINKGIIGSNQAVTYVSEGENIIYENYGGFAINRDLLPGNRSGNYDFSDYHYEAIGDSKTAGYMSNMSYDFVDYISVWPSSPSSGYYQITADGTYHGVEASAGDGILYNSNTDTATLMKGGCAYIDETAHKAWVYPKGTAYPQLIGIKTGINVINRAVPATCFAYYDALSPESRSASAYNQASHIAANTDVVTIYMGVNDRVNGADDPSSIGNYVCERDNNNDKFDVRTFKGAIRQTIKNIKLIAPMATIIFFVEDDGNPGYDGGSSRWQMIEEVAMEYYLPVVNLCKCGMNINNDYQDRKWQPRSDGLHESTVGHDFLARAVGGEIKKYLW